MLAENIEPVMTYFVWHADVVIERDNPIDPPVQVNANNSGHVVGNFSSFEMERSALAWLAEQIGEDPERMEVINFTWTDLPVAIPDYPPPPAE